MLTRCHDAWPGLKQEHMLMVRFPKGVPVCATWPQLEFSGLQLDAERRLGPVHTSPTHRCFSPVLTCSRCHKAGAVCNANPSHRDAPNLKLKCKGSPSSWHPLRKPVLLSATQTILLGTEGKEEESTSVVRAKKRGCLPVKVFLISETLQTAVRY